MNRQAGSTRASQDRFVVALARYVEALDRRYRGGPAELSARGLAIGADRANMPAMPDRRRPPAA
jgi:hypothetical protein